jgi:N-acyl-D-amino-acid deacylase
MYSTIFKNAKIYDGIANEPFMGDVAIEGDKIVNIAEKINSSAENVHDLQGLTLTPGFIDLQNHSDSYWQIFDNPKFDSLITQGFTTLLIGNCGASLAPLLSNDALYSIQKWHSLEGANINWQTLTNTLKNFQNINSHVI